MNVFDCVVVGAGPAGLSASLTLGRARRKIALFDDGTNRNRVANQSNGFLTRDGIKPAEFKEIGMREITRYPSVHYFKTTVQELSKNQNGQFIAKTKDGQEFISDKLLLATGIQEHFSVPSIRDYYGKSLFNCPYCDGWELRDKQLIIIAEKEEHALHMAKLLYNWSKDFVVLSNGGEFSKRGIRELEKRNILVKMEPIRNLIGDRGYIEQVELASGEKVNCSGGFVVPTFYRPNPFLVQFNCDINEHGEVITDGLGRTSCQNVYIAGELKRISPSSLINSAADGYKVALSINQDLSEERF
ncbi:NAD(P)/FAD-dependent oxidoreductase [Lysinibacillus halotolerans]|uniref:NAD(P)/FAD-dependent oxidoreductase n=1 Tax=Lysinibacillus halotolerans TaxID=1368476 RepID=A0A3M8HH30_9BACI|nr:NAD(P)/FAD-dependent oxidoreductase [Lysinibacillus halotolerans]RND01391.1 NAD(P)/FAD-dependent oxidoreductase [Lysinibacillus halotolerans]